MSSNSSEQYVVAIDLGGTNLRAALVGRHGQIREHLKRATPKSGAAADIVAAIAAAVRECESAAEKKATIAAISVVVPGSVQAGTGTVVNAPNIRSLSGFNLEDALYKELGGAVLIENDANAAAVGEMWQGAARDCRTIICLTLGTGVGSGIVLNGELWRGIDGTAGEIGHSSIEPFGGVRCKCGSVGCLEVYASATALVRIAHERIEQNPSSPLYSNDRSDLTARMIFEAARQGDEFARGLFTEMGTKLGVAMANIVNIFNPEMIVIGGGVSAAFDLFAATARAEMQKRAFAVPAKRCRIVKAECGDNAGLFGAGWLGWQKIRRQNRKTAPAI